MLEIKFYKTKICVDFTFFAVIAFFFYFDKSKVGLLSIAACAVHEMGHLLVLFVEKRNFSSLIFYGGGIKIGYEKNIDATISLILFGCIFNFFVFFIFYFFPNISINFKIFAVINLIIGLFNLLPFRYFDGGRLFEKIILKNMPAQNALKIIKITEKAFIIFTLAVPVFFIYFKIINLTVLLIMLYVAITEYTIKRM